jgi:hypothetical protein
MKLARVVSNGIVALAITTLTPTLVALQVQSKTWSRPLTAWGAPDLQGVWTNKTITPFERPSSFAGRAYLTAEEAATLEASLAAQRAAADGNSEPGNVGFYNQHWLDSGTRVSTTRQTSLVVDPPDGRVPALTPAGQARAAIALETGQGVSGVDVSERRGTDGPEQRSLWERCVTRGVPRLPDFYNNNFLILQTPDYVVILMEMIHEARLIPLDGRPHLGRHLGQWLGDSRGRWEGDTLVVDTTNFSAETNFRGSGEGLHLVERFTRAAVDTIIYEFTAEDPTTWTRSWTARIPMTRTDAPLFEYACHEGNYAMTNILAGARATESAAADTARPR